MRICGSGSRRAKSMRIHADMRIRIQANQINADPSMRICGSGPRRAKSMRIHVDMRIRIKTSQINADPDPKQRLIITQLTYIEELLVGREDGL